MNRTRRTTRKTYAGLKTGKGGGRAQPVRPWWLPAMMMFARFSVWIAGPIIIALYVGKWLDGKYGTEPWLFLGTIGLSFLVSMFGLTTSALKEFKKIERENDKKESSNDDPPAGGQKPNHGLNPKS